MEHRHTLLEVLITVVHVQIMSEIQSNKINIYQFPTTDDTVRELNTQMNVSPFAAVHCRE